MATHPTAERLVAAAASLIDERGANALTVRELLASCDISSGSLYHHIGSLEELVRRVAEQSFTEWSSRFIAALEASGLAAAYRADAKWGRHHPGLAALIEETSHSGRLGSQALTFGMALRDWLRRFGVPDETTAQVAAAIVLGPLIELRRLERITGRAGTSQDDIIVAGAVEAALTSLRRSAPHKTTSRRRSIDRVSSAD